ncbi:SIR2 family protein [Enterococcus faecalis]|uniref:SIR2 family protein n=1 Tax=Enterococcus faecalis TaxID=1351 RepID=UPI003D236591
MKKVIGAVNCECFMCKNNNSFDMPNEIIESVKKKELVLFCGAGISTESKAVLPTSFYMDVLTFLNSEHNLNLDTDIAFSELMSKFCSIVPNGRKQLIRKINERFDRVQSFPELYNSATRFHKEVSKIPQIKTIVTTNWDDYFEKECLATSIVDNKDVALWNTFDRRVFKIHGSINNIGSIVATTNDYDKCYERLSNEPIGDRLKTLLGSNCVVFIGFSFGDEDLNKIIDILSERLDDFANQFYLVTVDKSWENNRDSRIIPIITDGQFFIHSLRNILIEEGHLVANDIYDFARYASQVASDFHTDWLNEIDNFNEKLASFPEIILSIAYQDGMIHAYQRCYANRKKGDYLIPGYLSKIVASYHSLVDQHEKNKNYLQMYYDCLLFPLHSCRWF